MTTILSVARGHNGSTTLMQDGKIIFYLEEERLSRFKYDGSPLMGIKKAFETVDKIDHLVICHTHRHGPNLDWTGEDMYEGYLRKLVAKKYEFETHYVDSIHHQMHASCGFYNSGFDEAAVLIADGAGSFLQLGDPINDVGYEFETIFDASYENGFDTVYKHIGTRMPFGIAEEDGIFITSYPGHTKMYEAVTMYCGFAAIDAGKLMGLAPYGKENDELPSFFGSDGEYGNTELIIPNYPNASALNVNRFPILAEDIKNHKEGEYTDVQKDLAYKIQEQTSERMCTLIERAVEKTGHTNIVICGGYGLNCVANYKYWERFPDLNIYCEPISHDGGTSIGGALMLHHRLNKTKKSTGKQASVYYGPQYDPSTYEESLGGLSVVDTSFDDVAKLIRDGNIVTIFQGRSEGGPRALGNRSILFDPTIKDGKDYVNSVKHREWFRPFACSIKKEAVNEWFDLQGREETPHMMYAVRCHDGVEEKIPSVIHVDGTCRIQTVTEEQNENYYKLIDAFEKLSEVPILFNTSFNLGGEPLVESIDDAVRTLLNSDIEYMYLPEIQKLVHVPND